MLSDGSKGMVTTLAQVVRAHGPGVLYSGWLPQYLRALPYGTLQFVFMEKIAAAMGSSVT